MYNMAQIAQRMFGVPLMIEESKALVIAEAFGPRILGAQVELGSGASGNAVAPASPRAGSILHDGLVSHLTAERKGYIKHNGVAVIEVLGSLVRRGSWLGQSSGMTSYEGLRAQIAAAAADPEIKAIALELDTPGGEAAGAFELAALVREVREVKPVYAFCAESAYSAGYAIASQASQIVVPEFGGCGSIGVIAMHAEMSRKLEQDGIAVTVIRAGQHKAEGNSVEPLPDALLKEWQTQCEKMRVSFAQLVGEGRGSRFDMAAALKTEARCFDGPAAVRLGLADRVADPKQAFDAMVASVNETGAWDGNIPDAGARVSLCSPGCETGDELPQQQKERHMSDKTQPVTDGGTKDKQAATPDAGVAANDRAVKITGMVAKAGLSATVAQELLASGCTVEAAGAQIIDKIAARTQDGGDIRNTDTSVRVVTDGVERTRAGMVEALSAKAGLEGGKRNEFSSMSLREMARFTLTSRGLAVPSGGGMAMVGAAFVPGMAGGQHTSADFGNVLADVAHKSMLKGYAEAAESFQMFTRAGILTDFKKTKRVGMGLFPALDEVGEDAEFNYASVGDFGEEIMLATYGKLFKISRQAVINDDLGAFTDIPRKMGRASKRTVAALVYAILNGNPNMSDGKALFHADHGNLASSGSAPSETSIDAGMTAMAKQKPRGTDDDSAVLNIEPKYLLASHTNRSAVLRALNSEKAPDTSGSKGQQAYNTVYKAAEPIFDARITGKAWFLAADPEAHDTIEVAYLDGIQEPFIEQQDGWTVDGTEMKVRLDAGVSATAYHGLYKDPGQA
ncbi:S49 family peptidase [Leisingera caerulea]|uniref:S49 family peptidase n=1 Tax=Leisingera caerulea TaxID=506591 RepID=A0ABY5X055_LEICA|nr:S49 family peptidase [Leisingera caerulea]UWQ59960.1 S49 family peptidase [Leisingera caerulea]